MSKIANCTNCGREVTYKTKRPKLCPACRRGQPKVYSGKPRLPKSSKKERLVQRLMAQILPRADFILNGYYSWLPSPKEQPLQLDMYFPDLRLAIEVDGRQHYEFSPYVHKTRAAFEYQVACDRLKNSGCRARGVTLLRIRYDRTITKKRLLVILQESGLLERLRQVTQIDDNEEGATAHARTQHRRRSRAA